MKPKALITAAMEASPMVTPPNIFVPPKNCSAVLAYLLA